MGDWLRRVTEVENGTDGVLEIKTAYQVESRLLAGQSKWIPATRFHNRSVSSGRCRDIRAVREGEREGLALSANDFRFYTKLTFRIEGEQLAVEKVPVDGSLTTEIGRIKLVQTFRRWQARKKPQINNENEDQQAECSLSSCSNERTTSHMDTNFLAVDFLLEKPGRPNLLPKASKAASFVDHILHPNTTDL